MSTSSQSQSPAIAKVKKQHKRNHSQAERRQKRIIKDNDALATFNPNWDWVNYRGAWLTNIIVICAVRLLYGIMPWITPELAWTLTNITYCFFSFLMLHWSIGTPFDFNGGACDGLTLWEQIDHEVQFTPAKKFFTALPIGLFLLSTHYTHYDAITFCVNFIALATVLIAKLPVMHRVRLFGIHKIVD